MTDDRRKRLTMRVMDEGHARHLLDRLDRLVALAERRDRLRPATAADPTFPPDERSK